MRKNLLSIAFFVIIGSLILTGCGNGKSSSHAPTGVNTGIPSIMQLLPLQYVAQTTSYLYFKAKVLDGNGNPVKNEPVTFTNLSLVGTLQPPLVATAGGVGIAAGGPVVVNTDGLGYATITLYSATSGFATVRAEVNTGVGMVRDSKTVYFTAGSLNLLPSMILEVDAEGDGSWDETSDFIFFETPTDDIVQVRATVYDEFGLLEPSSVVTFGADVPYRIGPDPEAACSDGSDVCEVFFMFGNTSTTNASGQASVFVQVISPALRDIQTLFNVTASADNGAAGLVTLFVQPVTVASVALSANPVSVETENTSDITAFVTTNLGTIVPDGTAVSFRTDPADSLLDPPPVPLTDPDPCGSIIPFAQTTDGVAEVEFTAPAAVGTCTMTGTSVGVSGTVDVIVVTGIGLTIVPGTWTADGTGGDTQAFTITGGVPPYIVTSTEPFSVFDSGAGDGVWNVAASGDSFTANVTTSTCPATVTLDVFDSVGDSTSATVTIMTSTPLSIDLTSATICENNGGCGAGTEVSPSFTISGGIAPYFVVSSSIGVITNPVTNPFTVDAIDGSITADTTVNLTVTDSCGTTLPDVPIFVINQ